MPENDANPLTYANDIRSQKRIELDNLVLDKIRIYNGLTLRQIENLEIPIPEHLRTKKRPDEKIERKFLINSLSRLEGKTGETPKIYSRYKEEPIHGKSIKEYFYGTQESDKTIITMVSDGACAYFAGWHGYECTKKYSRFGSKGGSLYK